MEYFFMPKVILFYSICLSALFKPYHFFWQCMQPDKTTLSSKHRDVEMIQNHEENIYLDSTKKTSSAFSQDHSK